MADTLTLDRIAMKNRATAHLRVYVGGLPDSATVEELYDHFIPFGKINGIIINRVFGFVQFETESSAQDAIAKADGSVYQGKQLTVRTAQSHTDKMRRDAERIEVVTIHPEVPPAVALSDNIPTVPDDNNEELYDSYGNFIGEQTSNFREDEHDDGYQKTWTERGRGRGGRMRGARGRPPSGFRDRSPLRGAPPKGDWPERPGYDRFPQPEYPRSIPVPLSERNDCEIIVVSKGLTEYAEYIEGRLKRLGIVVDLLFPMEDVPIGKVLGNIASRGCLYAILVMQENQENRSLTLTILHGLPQEHRNMPVEDALQLLSRNFAEVRRGGPAGREAVYALLGQLADGRALTALQYDKVIEYLQERREQQVKVELGEPTAPTNKTQVDLQQRILTILNEKKVMAKSDSPPPQPPPAPPLAHPLAPAAPSQNKLLNDPTVRKALDSILQKFT